MRNKDNNRVIAYLQSRGIDKEIILDCIRRGVLYESVMYHACVFVGKNEQGKSRFACIRSTSGNFKSDAVGSDKKYGFTLPPNNGNCREAAVFESPVDILSHKTLCKEGLIDWDGWRLSLGGTSLLSLAYFLNQRPEVDKCLICTDNDEAGNSAAVKIAELPGVATLRSPPETGKDFNETLQIIRGISRKEVDVPCSSK
jgi:hypothetical protein